MRRQKKRKQTEMDESWLLPYADLLTLLVALFIVLFAMSEIDTQKYKELSQVFKNEFSGGNGILEYQNSPVESEEETQLEAKEDEEEEEEEKKSNREAMEIDRLKTLQQKFNHYIAENNLSELLGTELTGDGLLVTILNDVSFKSGSAEVKADGREVIQSISDLLYTDPPHQIIVSGHADDRPIHTAEFSSNWELSVMRAVNFMRLLLENGKLDPERFSAKGYGEHQPLFPNTNEENRAKNRRVEVLILPNLDDQEDEES